MLTQPLQPSETSVLPLQTTFHESESEGELDRKIFSPDMFDKPEWKYFLMRSFVRHFKQV